MSLRHKNTTIDILEDCLNSLYKARKSNLHSKAMKYERQHQKRMVKNKGQQRPRTPNPNVDYDDAYGAEEDGFMDDLASSLTLDPVPAAPTNSSISNSQIDNTSPPDTKQRRAYNYDNQKDSPMLFKTGTDTFTSLTAKKEDAKAGQAFIDFRNEIEKWWNDNQLRRNDSDSRGKLADYLTDQYLAKRLDPLPPSKTVSGLRKAMSQIIEEIGSGKALPSDWPAKAFNFEMPDDLANQMRGDPPPAEGEIPGTDKRGPAGHQRRIASKMEQEKEIMKKQYESYARQKKAHDTHEDHAVAKEYEQHLNDIKSLISDIQTTPQLDDA